jgi:hypothetical protein
MLSAIISGACVLSPSVLLDIAYAGIDKLVLGIASSMLTMQKLIVEEMVAAINALTREALCEAFKVVVASNAAVTALRNTEALGPLRAILAPIPQPLAFLSDVGSRMSLTSEDKHALDTVSLLLDMLGDESSLSGQGQAGMSTRSSRPSVSILEMIDDMHKTFTTGVTWQHLLDSAESCTFSCERCCLYHDVITTQSGNPSNSAVTCTGGTLVRGAGELVPIVPEILPGVQYTIELFISKLVRKLALRFADDIDPATFPEASRDQYSNGQRISGVTNGWAKVEKNGINDAWERHLL